MAATPVGIWPLSEIAATSKRLANLGFMSLRPPSAPNRAPYWAKILSHKRLGTRREPTSHKRQSVRYDVIDVMSWLPAENCSRLVRYADPKSDV